MKKTFIIFVSLLNFQISLAQEMTAEKIGAILTNISDTIQGIDGRWQFKIKEITFLCITDTKYNRMRIISPITESYLLNDKLKSAALIANFHSALDVKYAIAEGILWSVFIHPLRELSEKQVKDAVSQVYSANITFGTTFSSTSLLFPGSIKKEEKKPKIILKEKY